MKTSILALSVVLSLSNIVVLAALADDNLTYAPTIAPLKNPAVQRPFGGKNQGIEFRCKPGTEVLATADGTVAAVGKVHLYIQHRPTVGTIYYGLRDFKVAKGAAVTKGQVIGKCKSTKLHYEVRLGGMPVDPGAFVGAKVK